MTYFEQLHRRVGALAATQMFFIGGSPKSGTTWLQLLLDAHPDVICKGESQVINHLGRLLMETLDKHNQLLTQKNTTVFAELPAFPRFNRDHLSYLLAAGLLLLLNETTDGRTPAALGEKTPDNVRFFDVLHAIFPHARFIHIVRDGRDCAVSGWFHTERTSRDYSRQQFPTLAGYALMFAREWAKDLDEAAAFAAAHGDLCLTLRYEDLVAAPVPALGRVFAFLGVSADAAVVRACCEAAAFSRLSGGRTPGQADAGSFFRNGRPGDWRNHMGAELAATFRSTSGAWLERFGYE